MKGLLCLCCCAVAICGLKHYCSGIGKVHNYQEDYGTHSPSMDYRSSNQLLGRGGSLTCSAACKSASPAGSSMDGACLSHQPSLGWALH